MRARRIEKIAAILAASRLCPHYGDQDRFANADSCNFVFILRSIGKPIHHQKWFQPPIPTMPLLTRQIRQILATFGGSRPTEQDTPRVVSLQPLLVGKGQVTNGCELEASIRLSISSLRSLDSCDLDESAALVEPPSDIDSTDSVGSIEDPIHLAGDGYKISFEALRFTYLLVTLVVMLADGLQGRSTGGNG